MINRIVSDTGPLISLEKMERGFDFIHKLYDIILVPPAVLDELTEYYPSSEAYLQHYRIKNFIQVIPVQELNILDRNHLHDGESQAISLAAQLNLPLLIEENSGRKIANLLGLQVSGIAKQIIIAYRKNLIDIQNAEKKLKELLTAHRINQRVYDLVLNKIYTL